jgi:hypothetical protein
VAQDEELPMKGIVAAALAVACVVGFSVLRTDQAPPSRTGLGLCAIRRFS